MDTKAAFEKWLSPKFEFMMRHGLGITEIKRRREIYWDAWQASRAAIEIDLDFIHPLNFDLHKIEEEITSHGIRIKGKTE